MYPVTDFVTFRARLSQQGKARPAVNGRALDKGCNAAMLAQAYSRRASRKALIGGVSSLGKDPAIPGETCLAAKRFATR
ncbi:MAG: hypothetical protein Tsb002_33750 [Wenzhouxiangellaceae bacterium]